MKSDVLNNKRSGEPETRWEAGGWRLEVDAYRKQSNPPSDSGFPRLLSLSSLPGQSWGTHHAPHQQKGEFFATHQSFHPVEEIITDTRSWAALNLSPRCLGRVDFRHL